MHVNNNINLPLIMITKINCTLIILFERDFSSKVNRNRKKNIAVEITSEIHDLEPKSSHQTLKIKDTHKHHLIE